MLRAMDDLRHLPAPRHALDAVVHPDPYPWYRERAAREPLAFDAELGLWVAASAEAVRAVLCHPAARVRPPQEPVPAPLAGTAVGAMFGRWARMNDGGPHAAVKPMLQGALGALPLPRCQPAGEACRLALAGPAALDAFVLGWPVQAMAQLLGLAPADAVAQEVRAVVAAISPRADTPRREQGDAAARALQQRWQQAQATPLSMLLADAARSADIDAAGLSANSLSLLVQTQDATAGLVANTLHRLARDAGLGEAVRRGSVPLLPLLDEVLRFDAPIQNTRRWLAGEAQVLGRTLRAGDAVLVLLAAANHDPAVNPSPERFDRERAAPVSFTFGLGGHACPGAVLARSLAAAALQGLLDAGLEPRALGPARRWHALPNARIARFSPAQENASS
jgi:cytochrome P450